MFYNPEETFLSDKTPVTALTELLAGVLPECEGVGELASALEKADRQELILDYAALFVGPFELQAPPYGSVYLDKNKRLNDESTMAVAEIYRKFGLNVDEGMNEPADHIAIELEFIHTALITIGNMKTANRDASEPEMLLSTFISKYYQPFASQMCGMMEKNASTDFYKTVAKLLSAFNKLL